MTIEITGIEVRCPYQTFEGMKRRVAELEAECERLRKEKRAPVQSTPESVDARFVAMTLAKPIAQLAVANCDPATVRGWPWPALHELGTLLAAYADEDGDRALAELAQQFRTFADECVATDAFRAERHAAVLGMAEPEPDAAS